MNRLMKIKFTADLNVVPFNRPRFRNGRGFNSARYSAFKENLGYKARAAMEGREPIKGAFKISIDFYKKSNQNILKNTFVTTNPNKPHPGNVKSQVNAISFIVFTSSVFKLFEAPAPIIAVVFA